MNKLTKKINNNLHGFRIFFKNKMFKSTSLRQEISEKKKYVHEYISL